jgi:hypothetical protein
MQSNKDSSGGKSHPPRKGKSGGAVSEKAMAKKAARSAGSPTGPNKHGEKKTTPR